MLIENLNNFIMPFYDKYFSVDIGPHPLPPIILVFLFQSIRTVTFAF